MTHASLALWATLSSRQPIRLRPALNALALRQVNDPSLVPDAVFEGQSLLTLASAWSGDPARSKTPETWFEPASCDAVALRLMERGANPWRPLSPEEVAASDLAQALASGFAARGGVAPFLTALDHGAWPLVAAFLRHPSRPEWEDIFTRCFWNQPGFGQASLFNEPLQKHPELWSVLVACSLDPNFRHPITQDPLLFMATTAEAAGDLVKRGADPKARDADGHTLLERYDQRHFGAAQAADRTAWAKVMGHDNVTDRQIWVDGCSGIWAKVRPLFGRPAQMKTWQWDPKDGGPPLTLLDAAGHGFISNARRAQRDSLYSHLTKGVEESAAVPDIAWLAYQPVDDTIAPEANAKRAVRAVTAWVDLDRRLAALDFQPSATDRDGGNQENFNGWLTNTRPPEQRDAVLDQWLRWHDLQPARWTWPGSFINVTTGALPEGHQAWAPRHQVAVLAHQAKWRIYQADLAISIVGHTANAHPTQQATNREKARTAQEAVNEVLTEMFAARRAAGASFPSHQWDQIRTALTGSITGTLKADIEQRWTAWEREDHALNHQAPERPTPRSRYRS